MPATAPSDGRLAPWIRWSAVALLVLGLFLMMRLLPVAPWLERFRDWIESIGPLGPIVFIAAYVLATILLIPGSLLTLIAGAIWGLVAGTIIISIGSTLGVAATFLVGRYIARNRVSRFIERSERFSAIDRAIGKGGWKIVALLRLSPVIPFNLQNYAYGLTPIGFWTCVLTSWLFMLPGTFMYIYLGKTIGVAAFTAAGAARERTAGEWVLLGVGLVATIVVTTYLTMLARRILRQQTSIKSDGGRNQEGTAI